MESYSLNSNSYPKLIFFTGKVANFVKLLLFMFGDIISFTNFPRCKWTLKKHMKLTRLLVIMSVWKFNSEKNQMS